MPKNISEVLMKTIAFAKKGQGTLGCSAMDLRFYMMSFRYLYTVGLLSPQTLASSLIFSFPAA